MQEDDDDGNGDIDEEAALNTDANKRVTRPMFTHDESIIEMEIDSNRVSSIRFKGLCEIDLKLFLCKNGLSMFVLSFSIRAT